MNDLTSLLDSARVWVIDPAEAPPAKEPPPDPLREFADKIADNYLDKYRPSQAFLRDELKACTDAFDTFEYDEAAMWIVTPFITLENVELGRFKVSIHLKALAKDYSAERLTAQALDPNPACDYATVTHPHVKYETVCLGVGNEAWHKAVDEGRLCDAFDIVLAVLQTYNDDNPHVSLDEWEDGASKSRANESPADTTSYCASCHEESDDDACTRCENNLCKYCSRSCSDCDDEFLCQHCANRRLVSCEACGDDLCEECRESSKNGYYCADCLPEEKPDEEPDDEEEEADDDDEEDVT